MTTKTITTLRPITLHGSCYVPDSFCPRIELCSVACKKFVPEKTCTRLTNTRAGFLYKTTCTSLWYKFLERVLPSVDKPRSAWENVLLVCQFDSWTSLLTVLLVRDWSSDVRGWSQYDV